MDVVRAVMLRLVCFIGWVMVRYSATYMDGEARQGPFTAWLCLTLAAVMLLVTSANILQFALAWGRFKLAAVSSFAFVEATGPICAGKLGRDALYIAPDAAGAGPQPRLDPPLPLDAWIDAAEPILRAISLTTGFARPVVLAGHGAHVVNNPFASGLHCGACGGYAGDVNVLLLAGLLNGVDVRAGLAERDIDIPADTFFVGALHDTTTDAITLFAEDHPAGARSSNIAQAKAWFAQAGVVTRSERALRLPRADQEVDIHLRSRDWAETRPEWALAGCKAFIAAPRPRTLAKASRAGPFFMTTSGKRTRISEFCN